MVRGRLSNSMFRVNVMQLDATACRLTDKKKAASVSLQNSKNKNIHGKRYYHTPPKKSKMACITHQMVAFDLNECIFLLVAQPDIPLPAVPAVVLLPCLSEKCGRE